MTIYLSDLIKNPNLLTELREKRRREERHQARPVPNRLAKPTFFPKPPEIKPSLSHRRAIQLFD